MSPPHQLIYQKHLQMFQLVSGCYTIVGRWQMSRRQSSTALTRRMSHKDPAGSQRAVSKRGRKKCDQEKVLENGSFERNANKSIQELQGASEGVDSAVKPLLNQRRQQRLTWTKQEQNWTAAQSSTVLFGDGSLFYISCGGEGPRVWRKSREAQNPRVKFPRSLMVWVSSAGPLGFLKQTSTRRFHLF